MRTIKFILLLTFAVSMATATYAKKKKASPKDWSKVDFFDAYKVKTKFGKPASKSLTKNPTFINDYSIKNALKMKGMESNSNGTVHSAVTFAGIPRDKFQAMVDELYQQFQDELTSAGLHLTNGDELLKCDFAEKKKSDRGAVIGKTSNEPELEKASILDQMILGYGALAVKEGINFRPLDKNLYYSTKKVAPNFYQKLATLEDVNLISISYYVTFASFDGGRGYKNAVLQTNSVMSVNPVITIINPKGTYSYIAMMKGPIWGGADWSLGVKQTDLNDLEYFGLATSAKYVIEADPDKYIKELKDIIMNYQVAIAKALKETM